MQRSTSISITTSFFSKADEEKEISEWTQNERDAATDDMYGRNSRDNSSHDDDEHYDDNDDDDISDELLQRFNDELEEIPVQDKIDCL